MSTQPHPIRLHLAVPELREETDLRDYASTLHDALVATGDTALLALERDQLAVVVPRSRTPGRCAARLSAAWEACLGAAHPLVAVARLLDPEQPLLAVGH
jgi:hypothetical protein